MLTHPFCFVPRPPEHAGDPPALLPHIEVVTSGSELSETSIRFFSQEEVMSIKRNILRQALETFGKKLRIMSSYPFKGV